METVKLNIGCGDKKFDGFINIDIDPAADIQADITKGIPFPDNSVSGIYCEHFIEHLSQQEAIGFFRECRRVLMPDGYARIATVDLDDINQKYFSNWKDQHWIKEFGYDWIDNRCELQNIVMREWGHKWLFNQEELVRLGTFAGLSFSNRCEIGESEVPFLKNLEWRKDSSLIIEFKKQWDNCRLENPLVSILIPAYNYDYLKKCIESAINQTYPNTEIIICDDSQGQEIEKIVKSFDDSDKSIAYYKNERNLQSVGNYMRCFSFAKGEYVKFLNDDDLLHPTCISRMVDCFQRYPEAALVTSHRQCIDADGQELADFESTQRPVKEDSIINGVSAAKFMLANCINFIGEPTTTLFRRRDLSENRPTLISLGGRPYVYNVDVVMWVNLLSKGDLIYLHDSLSLFRLHPKQEQRQPGGREKGIDAWQKLREDGLRMGLLDPKGPYELHLRPLASCSNHPGSRNLWGSESYQQNLVSTGKTKHGRLHTEQVTMPGLKTPQLNQADPIEEELQKARRFLLDGNLKAACDCYRIVLDMDEHHFEAIKYLGIIAYEASMPEKALLFLKRANEINPSDNAVKAYIDKCNNQSVHENEESSAAV